MRPADFSCSQLFFPRRPHPVRVVLAVLVVVLALAVCANGALAQTTCTVEWDGGGDGTSWHDPANWSGGALPSSSDVVCIDHAGTTVVEVSQGSHEIGALFAENDLAVSDEGVLRLLGDSQVNGDLELAGGIVNIDTELISTGELRWLAGEFSSDAGPGLLRNQGSMLVQEPGQGKLVATRLRNEGTVVVSELTRITVDVDASVLNQGEWLFLGRADLASEEPTPWFVNDRDGLIRKQGAGLVEVQASLVPRAGSRIEVNEGELYFVRGSAEGTGGTFQVAAGATLAFEAPLDTPFHWEGVYDGHVDDGGLLVFDGRMQMPESAGDDDVSVALDIGGEGFTWRGGELGVDPGPALLVNRDVFNVPSNGWGALVATRFRNEGTVVMDDPAEITVDLNARVLNQGEWLFRGRADLASEEPTPWFVNDRDGLIRKQGAGLVEVQVSLVPRAESRIEVNGGELYFVGGSAEGTGGTFQVAAGATLAFEAPLDTPFHWEGVYDGHVDDGGLLVFDGRMQMPESAGDDDVSVALDIGGEGFTWRGGELGVDPGPALLVNRDVFNVPSNGRGALVATRLRNEGTVVMDDLARITVDVNASVLNQGEWLFLDWTELASEEPTPWFVNDLDGLIRKEGAGSVGVDTSFENAGEIHVHGGFLQFIVSVPTAGHITIHEDATLEIIGALIQSDGTTHLAGGTLAATGGVALDGGVLSGDGTVDADLTSVAQVRPGNSTGRIQVTGSYEQSAEALLGVKLGGLEPGDEFDQLAVAGAATLAGVLEISLLDDFTPTVGSTFDLVTHPAGGATGEFDLVELPEPPELTDWQLEFADEAVRLELVSTAVADLSLDKTAAPDPVSPGNELTYTLTVTNLGPAPATGVMVTDLLPEELAFESATEGCEEEGGLVTCQIGELDPDDAQTVEIVVVPTAEAVGTITNMAEASANEPDPDLDNNTATVEVTVQDIVVGDATRVVGPVELRTVDQRRPRSDDIGCPGAVPNCRQLVEGAVARSFDRDDPAVGKNPAQADYIDLWESDLHVAECTTDHTGHCTLVEPGPGNYLVVVRIEDPRSPNPADPNVIFAGKPNSEDEFVEVEPGVWEGPDKEFQIIKLVRRSGQVQYSGGIVQVLQGSYLELVYPDFAVWEDTADGFVYPFLFTSDSDWEVDICARVPRGYEIVGLYDEDGELAEGADCTQTFVTGETRVVAFEVEMVGSPAPHLDARLQIRNPAGTLTVLQLDVPGIRIGQDPPGHGGPMPCPPSRPTCR